MVAMTRKQHYISQVLLAASDVEMRATIGHALDRSGYEVRRCDDLHKLVHMATVETTVCRISDYDLIVCDVHLLEENTTTALAGLQQQGLLPPIILFRRRQQDHDVELAGRLSVSAMLDGNIHKK